MTNQHKITGTLRGIYINSVQKKSDAEISEILICKNTFVDELFDYAKEEFLKRQNKLS